MEAALEDRLIARFSLATFMESVRLWEEGIASAEEIDIAMRAGAGLPQGPFHWADARGLDVVLEELTILAQEGLSRFTPPPSLRERVERGWLGMKSGQGYLSYETQEA